MTKTLKKVIAGVSALAIIAGAAVGGWAINEYVIKDNQFTITDQADGGDGGMIVGESEGNGVSLMSTKIAPADYEAYGISPMAESAQQLRATITPSNATNQKVDWTVKWKNASSSWANGKTVTDYVTVTPTSDGALTANVECKQAFGEQVQVVCTSRQNTKANATATVDYAKRVTSGTINYLGDKTGNVNITSAGSEFTYNASGTFEDNHINAESVFMPTMSIGTIDDSFTYEISVLLSDDWFNALDSNGFTSYMADTGTFALTGSNSVSIGTYMGIEGLNNVGIDYVYEDAGGAFNAFADALRAMEDKTIFTLKVVATGTYSTFTGTCDFYYNATNLQILVESVGGLKNIIF